MGGWVGGLNLLHRTSCRVLNMPMKLTPIARIRNCDDILLIVMQMGKKLMVSVEGFVATVALSFHNTVIGQ